MMNYDTRRILAAIAAVDRKVDIIVDTIADLDQALTDFETASDAAEAEVLAAVNDILAKVAGSVDLTAEVDRLHAAQAKQSAAADAIKALDLPPVVTPPPVPIQ
jgi:hypothetical protein